MVITRIGRVGMGVMLAACLLAGCSEPSPGVAETTKPGLPGGIDMDPASFGPVATWIKREDTFAIVTWGSGSCPPIATALTAEGRDRIAVEFEPSPNDPCTADMSPTTHEFTLPDEVTDIPVFIEVSYADVPGVDALTLE